MTFARIGIIGVSHVGAHVADAILAKGIAGELYLCDTDEKLCIAQANDLTDAMAFYPHHAKIHSCEDRYEELAGCDIIVNAAGHIKLAAESRDGELFATSEEPKTFVKRIMNAGFEGIWLSIANPCDVIATEVYELSGMDSSRVLGSGTALDSTRFRHALANATGYDQHAISSWMLGEHGNSQFAVWSHVSFGGMSIIELEEQTDVSFDRASIEQEARGGGYVTMAGKLCTEYSIANAACSIISAIVFDTKLITPVSTLLTGQYGESGHYASLPCVIGKDGVEKVFEPKLTDSELEAFHASCAHIKENIAQLEW